MAFCRADEETWVCGGRWDVTAFTGCRDPATGIQRFCCPKMYQPMCGGRRG
jgi:hypothetical protein